MHRSRALVASLLAALMLAAFVAPALAVTRSELEKHRQTARNARKAAASADAAAAKLAGEVAALDKEVERIQAQADALEPKIDDATDRTRKIQREVDRLNSEVDKTQQELEKTQAEYARQQELLKERINSTYRQGNWFYLDIILGSSDIGDLVTRTEFVSRVIEANNDLAANLSATGDELSRSKVKLERSLDAIKLKKREAAAVERSLKNLQASREAAAAQREGVQQQKAQLMADNKANAARLRALAEEEEAESSRIAAELAAAGNGSGVYGGIMTWPVPSSNRITSPFGWRICPFHGREMHPGIDVGAPSGSPLVAAGSGTVIYAGYRGGYGNTVMIDHGEGVVTLYAHQVAGGIRVSKGQQVEEGQRIGAVGSTGYSTGPHLHFEVRVNGVARNPMGYM